MNYIEYKEGKVYDPAHLRQAKSVEELLLLARQGHPICTTSGREVRLLREASKLWAYDEWFVGIGEDGYWGTCIHQKETYFTNNLRLAPIAVKDGKSLHVGDVIEIVNPYYEHFSDPVTFSSHIMVESDIGSDWGRINWRWPAEVKA